jgi:outer membrane protein W
MWIVIVIGIDMAMHDKHFTLKKNIKCAFMCCVCFSKLIDTSIKTKMKEKNKRKVITSPLFFFISGGSRNYTYFLLLTMSTNYAYLGMAIPTMANDNVSLKIFILSRYNNMSKKGGLKFETIDGNVYKTRCGMVLYIRSVMQNNVPLLGYQFNS